MNRKTHFFLSSLLLVLAIFLTNARPVRSQTLQPVTISLDASGANYLHIFKNATSLSHVDFLLENKSGKTLIKMRLNTSGQFDSIPWEPYSALKPWTFNSPDGQKTIYAQFQTTTGEVVSAGATFVYDTTPPQGGFNILTKSVGPRSLYVNTQLTASDTWSPADFNYRLSASRNFENALWQAFNSNPKVPVTIDSKNYHDGQQQYLYAQLRDHVGNVTEVYTDMYIIDTTPPQLFIQIDPSDSLNQEVVVMAYDEHSDLGKMSVSNDPRLIDGVIQTDYKPTFPWIFDQRRVVWVKLEDSVGNTSEAYPAYLAPRTTLSVSPSGEPTPWVKALPSTDPTKQADPKYQEFMQKIAQLENKQNEGSEKQATLEARVVKQEQKINLLEKLIESIRAFLSSLFPFFH